MKHIIIGFSVILLILGDLNAQTTFPLEIGTKWFIRESGITIIDNYYFIQIEKDTLLPDGSIYSVLESYNREGIFKNKTYYRQSGSQVIEYPDKVILDYSWEKGDSADWTSGVTIGFVKWTGKYYVQKFGSGYYEIGNLNYSTFDDSIGFRVLYQGYHWSATSLEVVGTIMNGDTTGYSFGISSIPKPIEPLEGSLVPLPVTFKWTKLIGAKGYDIQLSHDFTFTTGIKEYFTDDTVIVLDKLDTMDIYFWRVRGVYPGIPRSPNYNGKFSAKSTFSIISISLPLVPLNNSIGISSQVELKWSNVPDSRFYEVQISTDSTFQSSVSNYNDLTDTSIFINNLEEGSTYFWRVKTVGAVNQYWSQIWKFTTISLPVDFVLYQNYPNPFNPKTTISFDIPEACLVNLTIYDILGSKIETLINEEKPAGSYKAEFNGTGLSSGIYYYDLKAGDYTEVKKMIFLK